MTGCKNTVRGGLLTKSINDKEIEPVHGCTRGVNRGHSSVVLCDRLRSSQPVRRPPPADANSPRGMEASAAVSWLLYSVPLPLARFSSAPCNAATNCDKLSVSPYGAMRRNGVRFALLSAAKRGYHAFIAPFCRSAKCRGHV